MDTTFYLDVVCLSSVDSFLSTSTTLITMSLEKLKHRWFSGRILACHAVGPGSIPGRCVFLVSRRGLAGCVKERYKVVESDFRSDIHILHFWKIEFRSDIRILHFCNMNRGNTNKVIRVKTYGFCVNLTFVAMLSSPPWDHWQVTVVGADPYLG